MFNFILAALATWGPVAVIAFAVLVAVWIIWSILRSDPRQRIAQVRRFDRWPPERQARTRQRMWIEIVALAIALAVLITLFDYWLAGKLSPATLAVLTWGTRR